MRRSFHGPSTSLLLTLALCVAVSAACQRGPAKELLRDDLQRELDVAFEAGLFEIDTLRRMGSASFTGEGDAEGGIHVYYDAVLVLQRDYALTSWKGLNLGTLAFIVGATEAGVSGIRSRGNESGDALRVHGRLSYVSRDGAWQRVGTPQPQSAAEPPALQSTIGASPNRVLDEIRTSLDTAGEPQPGTHDSVIVGELRQAVSRIDLQLAHLDGGLTLGSGPRPGTYHRFGLALHEFSELSGFPIAVYESQGSLENGSLLRSRLLDFALVQSDVSETLYNGWIESGVLPNRELRSVASLWPEAVHLVTLEASGIADLAGLSGRRVGVGARGSGTRFNVLSIAMTSGMSGDAQPHIVDLGVLDGIRALEAGEIDAFFVTSAVPSPPLQALAARRDDVRFVSIDAPVVHTLAEKRFAYYVLEVDARSYPNQTEPFLTVGLASTLVTHEGVADAAVDRLLEMLVEQADTLSGRYFRAGFISSETMRLGLAVPLHPAAERFYSSARSADGTGDTKTE